MVDLMTRKSTSLAELWDVLFGIIVIGGAPFAGGTLATMLVLGCLKVFHVSETSAIYDISGMTSLLLGAGLAFCMALFYRIRKRLTPKPYIVLEALLGIFGALVFFAFWGVLVHASID